MLALSPLCAGMEDRLGSGGLSTGKRRPRAPQVAQPGLSMSSWKGLVTAGSWTLVLAQGRFAVMGDPRLGTSLELLCWHSGKGGMDGESGQDLAAQALGLDIQVGAGVAGRVQDATCPADSGVWLLVSLHKPQ